MLHGGLPCSLLSLRGEAVTPVNVPHAPADTIEVVHRLTPLGVAMAGADTFDPYTN